MSVSYTWTRSVWFITNHSFIGKVCLKEWDIQFDVASSLMNSWPCQGQFRWISRFSVTCSFCHKKVLYGFRRLRIFSFYDILWCFCVLFKALKLQSPFIFHCMQKTMEKCLHVLLLYSTEEGRSYRFVQQVNNKRNVIFGWKTPLKNKMM